MSLSDFVILKRIGAGCSGIVRLARRRADGQTYAVKELELPRDRRDAEAVVQETHLLASLDHPFIVHYFDAFVESGRLFMVMEHAANGTLGVVLSEHQKAGRPVEEAALWRYCLQILVALHAVHSAHIIHRDLKPPNIFLGKGDVVKLGDFGVARLLGGSGELATTVVGSPGYLAPELCSGEPYGPSADLWSFGIVLAELAALRHPFAGARNQAELAMRILAADVPPPPPGRYSPPLGRLVLACTQRQPARRPSALQLLCDPVVSQHAAELGLARMLPAEAQQQAAALARTAPPKGTREPTPSPPGSPCTVRSATFGSSRYCHFPAGFPACSGPPRSARPVRSA